MPPITSTGLALDGKQLQAVPSNATHEDVKVILNRAISAINNSNQDVIASDIVHMTVPPATDDVVLPVPHNLGYRPRALVFISDESITIAGTTYYHVDIPLPTYLGSFIPIGFGGSGSGLGIQFTSWLDYFADTKNLYIHLNNPLHLFGTLPLRYELRREASN